MVGNTGYLGFPITLAMVGKEYFAWALFYDMLGSLFGAYGLGVVLAAKFGNNIQNRIQVAKVIFINPALWSFGFGLLLRQVALPESSDLLHLIPFVCKVAYNLPPRMKTLCLVRGDYRVV
jgi:predicted permease